MSLIAVDVCTVQARAYANGVSQFDFARSRNKTGCHFTRHDRSTKPYISYRTAGIAASHFATLTVDRRRELTKSCIIATGPPVSLTRRQDVLVKIHFLPHKKIYLGHFAKLPNRFPRPTGASVNHPCA